MDNDRGALSVIRNIQRGLWVRIVVTVLLIAGILYTVVLSSLAARGSKPFKNSHGFFSIPSLATCLMPASYYYFVWILQYFALLFIAVYAIVMVAQKLVLGHSEKHCGALPLSFLVVLVISLNLNTGWLFAEDNLNASWSFVVSMLLFITNCIALSYATYNFSRCGKVLFRESIMDFWMGIGVMNAMAIYATWSLVQFFQSFTVFLAHETKMDMNKVCTGMLITLMLLIVLWFIIENTTLADCFNTIALHYLVLLWYLATLYPRQVQKSDSIMRGLLISNVILAVVALFFRLIILFRRNRGNKIYGVSSLATPRVQDIVEP